MCQPICERWVDYVQRSHRFYAWSATTTAAHITIFISHYAVEVSNLLYFRPTPAPRHTSLNSVAFARFSFVRSFLCTSKRQTLKTSLFSIYFPCVQNWWHSSTWKLRFDLVWKAMILLQFFCQLNWYDAFSENTIYSLRNHILPQNCYERIVQILSLESFWNVGSSFTGKWCTECNAINSSID